MAKTKIEVPLRLPKEMIDELKIIAKLAGLSVEAVITLCMALEVRKWQQSAAPEKQQD